MQTELEKLMERSGTYKQAITTVPIFKEKFDACENTKDEIIKVMAEALYFYSKKDEHLDKRLPSHNFIGRPIPLGVSVAKEALQKANELAKKCNES